MMTTDQLKKEFYNFSLTHQSKTLLTEHGNMEYLICGNGKPTILLFHGLAGNAQSVYRFILALESEYRILSPTVSALAIPTVDRVCEMIETVVKHEQVSPTIVIGGSFGGMLAQAYWYRNQSSVSRVVVFDSAPPNSHVGQRNRRATRLLNLLPWSIAKSLFKMSLLRLFNVSIETEEEKSILAFSREQFIERFRNLSKELLMSHAQISFDFMINGKVPDLSYWKGELLIIYSQDDPTTKQVSGAFEAIYPFARIVPLTGTGHLGSLLFFDKYISEIKRILP